MPNIDDTLAWTRIQDEFDVYKLVLILRLGELSPEGQACLADIIDPATPTSVKLKLKKGSRGRRRNLNCMLRDQKIGIFVEEKSEGVKIESVIEEAVKEFRCSRSTVQKARKAYKESKAATDVPGQKLRHASNFGTRAGIGGLSCCPCCDGIVSFQMEGVAV
jgi:hypothetical protein